MSEQKQTEKRHDRAFLYGMAAVMIVAALVIGTTHGPGDALGVFGLGCYLFGVADGSRSA